MEDSSPAHLNIPPELQAHLPPDLWRKLNREVPSRGVLLNALERLRSTLYQVSTFLPQLLVQEKMRRPVTGLVTGQVLRGSLLFSDVSGFTALSERLVGMGQQGAEILTNNMNRYFTRMLEIQSRSGGMLIKFAGDAMLVYFPEMEGGEHVCWAVRTALRMLAAMAEFARIETPSDPVTLKMKIGVATGEFLAASIGCAQRVEFIVLGPTVISTMAAEGASTGAGQLIVDQNSARELPQDATTSPNESYLVTPQKAGYFLVRHTNDKKLDDFEITAEKRRARGAMALNASPQALVAQMEIVLGQIHALTPYLASELVKQIVAHAQERSVRSQYRPTTVMFCNFIGPEALLTAWGEKGAARVTSLLSAYFNAMHDVITHYGGIVSRIDPYSKGTKMLVLFGAPVAHEDDPQRAVSAGLSMNVELEKLNQIWRRKFSRDLPPGMNTLIQHRIGITFGETYAGQVGALTQREYTVMGDEVNLAARLMEAGEMGQILLNGRVHEMVSDYFVLASIPSIRVKGKSKPVQIFMVVGPREDTITNRVRQRGPLAGRETELAQAETILSAALGGAGTFLSLQGPAGVGKSHLADTLIARAQSAGAKTLLKSCHSYTAETPYACWSDLLLTLAGITPNDYLPQVQYAKLHTLLETLGLPKFHAPRLAALMGLRSETGQTFQPVPEFFDESEMVGLRDAIGSLLGHLAAASPMLIFFEDADWMDLPSRQLLFSLKEQIETMPVLVLLAERGEHNHIQEAIQSSKLSNLPARARLSRKSESEYLMNVGHTLVLGPLSLEGTTALVSQLLATDLAQVIHEQSGGIPLFINEITYWLQQSRKISLDELRSVLQTSNFLQKLFLSRLETLLETQREIVKIASVIGNEFRTGELQVLLPPTIDSTTLSHHLRALAQARWITLTEAGADARYAYQQSLVREILYNSMPHEHRRQLHARLADYLCLPLTRRQEVQFKLAAFLETRPTANPGEKAERIADHYEQAEMWHSSARAWLKAASQEQQAGLFARASYSYACGLEMLNKIPAAVITIEIIILRAQLLTGQGDLGIQSGEYMPALNAYEAARDCLGENIPPKILFHLSCKLALVLTKQKRAREAEKLLRSLINQANRTERLIVIAILAWLLVRTGNPESSDWIDRARELADPDTEIQAFLDDLKGEWTLARARYLNLKLPIGAALCALRQGDRFLRDGAIDEAVGYYDMAMLNWQDQNPQVRGTALGLYRKAEALWRKGDETAARALLEEASVQLPKCATTLQKEGYNAIQRASKLISSDKAASWPDWKWNLYDDQFRIAVLFRTIQIE